MPRSEPELYKDKIEVSLDGRQIFYLFFGGAVIACLVFVLGVMVGKRVEARAHVDRAGTSAARDPLAALDALDATSRTAEAPRSAGPMEHAVTELDGAQRAARAALSAPAAAPSPVPPAAPTAQEPKSEKKAEKTEKAEKAEKSEKKAEPKSE